MVCIKRIIILVLFHTFCHGTLSSQNTEHFIRIIGNAEKLFNYERLTLSVVIAEVPPNDYRQARYRSVGQIRNEFLIELEKLGIDSSSLVLDKDAEFGFQYQKIRSERYTLMLNDNSIFKAFSNIFIDGVTIREVKYLFKAPGYEAEEELALLAIQDAQRKAARLAKEIGKKLGKVINIEDKSSGCCREIKDTKSAVYKMAYKLNVTFELLD